MPLLEIPYQIDPLVFEAMVIFLGVLLIDSGYWCRCDGQSLLMTVAGVVLVSIGIAYVWQLAL